MNKSECAIRSQAWMLLDYAKTESRKQLIRRIANRYIMNIREHLKGVDFAILIPVEQKVYMK